MAAWPRLRNASRTTPENSHATNTRIGYPFAIPNIAHSSVSARMTTPGPGLLASPVAGYMLRGPHRSPEWLAAPSLRPPTGEGDATPLPDASPCRPDFAAATATRPDSPPAARARSAAPPSGDAGARLRPGERSPRPLVVKLPAQEFSQEPPPPPRRHFPASHRKTGGDLDPPTRLRDVTADIHPGPCRKHRTPLHSTTSNRDSPRRIAP